MVRRLFITSQVLLIQYNVPRCVSAASSIHSIADSSRNLQSASQLSNAKSGRRLHLIKSTVSEDTIHDSLLDQTNSSRSTHPPFSPRALKSSLQTMMIDNPLEKTIRMGMRNSTFLFGEGHRRLRRQGRRRRRIPSIVAQTAESKKMQMYLTCFAIVFVW